jgi:SAM-dependent methyltransferase
MIWYRIKKTLNRSNIQEGKMNYETQPFDPAKHSQDDRIRYLEAKVAFLLDEVSGLRCLVRYLSSDKINEFPIVQQTRDSFNYQWQSLPEGHAMLSNEDWKKSVSETICKFSDLSPEWFENKKVMDAGCGQGRWTYGFGELKVNHCTSIDISDAGIARTKKIAQEFGENFQVLKKNLLEDLNLPCDYDMVWCFGVLHHTGNTYKGFKNLVKCVKPGGYIFLMIYGEPRPTALGDYNYYHEMFDMRCKLKNLPFDEKVRVLKEKYGTEQLHGYFDAVSPEINDLYRWDELANWLINSGFEDIKRTLPTHPNHHLVARKKYE